MTSNIHWEKNIGRRFQLRDLQIFFSVAEQSSMAKAARELGVTQPSVSAAIAGLETSLSARLFERSPRGVELTSVGQALLIRGRAAFDELRQGIRDIEFLRQPDVGDVRIGCPESIAAGFLPAVIDLLAQKHPRINLTVAHVVTPTLEFRELDDRRLDVILAMLAAPDPQNLSSNYSAEVLFDDRLCIVVGDKNRLARQRNVDLVELSKQPWVLGPPDSPAVSWIAEMFRRNKIEFPKRCVTTFSVHLRYNMAATGRFVSIMPLSAFHHAGERFGLAILPIKLPAPRWPATAVTLRSRNQSAVVNIFMECARSVAKTYISGRLEPRRTRGKRGHTGDPR